MSVTQETIRSKPGAKALIALGSNATSRHGSPQETVELALAALERDPLRLVAASRLYLTPFVPAGAGEDVVNAVAVVETALDPVALLDRLHAIELEFDRARGVRWSDRTLDLDLMAMGGLVLPDLDTLAHWMAMPFAEQRTNAPKELVLPHPRLQERAFVLVPAADVAPDWVHPVTGRTIAEMRDALPLADLAAVRRLGEEK